MVLPIDMRRVAVREVMRDGRARIRVMVGPPATGGLVGRKWRGGSLIAVSYGVHGGDLVLGQVERRMAGLAPPALRGLPLSPPPGRRLLPTRTEAAASPRGAHGRPMPNLLFSEAVTLLTLLTQMTLLTQSRGKWC